MRHWHQQGALDVTKTLDKYSINQLEIDWGHEETDLFKEVNSRGSYKDHEIHPGKKLFNKNLKSRNDQKNWLRPVWVYLQCPSLSGQFILRSQNIQQIGCLIM